MKKWIATERGNGLRAWCAFFHGEYIEYNKKLRKVRCNKCEIVRYDIEEI